MIYWVLLLHIYQPPFQNFEILQKINNESYSKLFDIFFRFPSAKLTLNINGSLTELLSNYNFFETLNKIKELAQKGQIKFTGSGIYHPILPLIPHTEITRQIKLNEEYNERIFGPSYANSKGFFPPELAISKDLLEIVEQMQYKWILASGIACPTDWPINIYHTYKSLPLFFRDDIISNQISFKKLGPSKFLSKLKTLFDDDYYVITAMDGETFGHHIKNYGEKFLAKIFTELEDEEEIQIIFLDDILDLFKKGESIVPIDSSWSSTPETLQKMNPYPLWSDPNNEIHRNQSYLQKTAIKLFKYLDQYASQIPRDRLEFYNNARKNLDKGEQSCRLWWANNSNFNENLVILGTQFLLQSVVNAYKALFSIPMKSDEISEIRCLYEDFKDNYYYLLQLIANKTEGRSRFKAFRK